MNPDYSSDIRQVQRFIFEHNLYLLTMFEKKIISFSSSNIWENKDVRKEYKESKMHATNIIDCDNFLTDAVKRLSQDLTKPIWNCVTKTDPRVVYREQSSSQPLEMINAMGKVFHTFFTRLKNEHEDQSNLRINLMSYELDRQVLSYQQEAKQNVHSSLNIEALADTTSSLFELLLEVTEKQETRLQEQVMEDDGTHSHNKQLQSMLSAASELLNMYLSKSDENFNNELDVFNKIVVSNFNDIINCKIGSVVLCLQPKLLTLPLLIHPMLISIHSLIKSQVQDLHRREEQKALRNSMDLLSSQNMNLNQSQNLSASSMLHMRQMKDEKEASGNYIFRQISKSQNISKVVFINLDGYESEFNLDVAKYLCKNMMYVSFPKESARRSNTKVNNKDKEQEQMDNMQQFKSERLLKKYYHGRLTAEQKYKLIENFKLPQKQHKKNLYIFPLHSRSLATTQSLPSLYKFQTAFTMFIMRQLLFAQILDFNPSIILISYSQKIMMEKESFVELIKQLTVLGNYKIVFYANICKNYMFEEYYSEQKHFKVIQEKYYQEFQSEMRMFTPSANKNAVLQQNVSVNCDLFQKMAIMLKVCSGTHNLNKSMQIDSFIEKYKNYRVLTYAGPLIQRLSDEFPNLSKLKMRLMDYTTLCRVLESYFNNKMDVVNKLFKRSISAFHTGLFRQIDKIIAGHSATNQNKMMIKPTGPNSNLNLNTNGQIMIKSNDIDLELNEEDKQRKKKVEQEICQLVSAMLKKLSPVEREQSWKNFKFQRSLEISTEKLETKHFAHLPIYRQNGPKKGQMPKKQTQNLICLQFYISSQRQKLPVELSPSTSKVYYSPIRKHPTALFYITNHLIKTSSTAFTTLYGKVTQQFDYKVSPKVQLQPVTFTNGPYLDQFETYSEFNYFESKNYVFMFWPKIYNAKKQMISRFIGEKYMGEVTQLVFCARRSSPQNFKMIYKGAESDFIIPRHGCQCYEIQTTNTIYIFGGFYSDERNYLQFQTDITRMVYTEPQTSVSDSSQFPTVSLQLVPKQFYFDFEELENNKEIKVITNLRNHMVRPKVEYEFLQSDEPQVQKDHRVVYLLGGVGQNFIRSYSMIGFMAHRLTFNVRTGSLVSIKRISMNNIIPVNTHQPIKLRMPMQAKILTHAENRAINYINGDSGLSGKGFTIYHNNVRYNPQNQRFQYETEYEVLDNDYRCHREQVDLLKKSVIDNRPKLSISAKNARGKQYNTNYLIATLQSNHKFILQLQLELPLDIKSMHPDLPAVVHLTGQSIISIDVNNTAIYAIIRHPIYTLDECLLVYHDLNEQQRKFKQKKCVEVQLKQLYRFDQDVSMNVIVVAKSDTIVVLHGQRFMKGVDVTELVLKRNRKKHMKIQTVNPNSQFTINNASSMGSTFLNANKPPLNPTPLLTSTNNTWLQQFYKDCQVPIVNGLSCSIFLNQNNGIILCFSFKSIPPEQNQNDSHEAVYVIIQKLDLNGEKYGWQLVVSRKYRIVVVSDETAKKHKRRDKLKLVQIVQHKRQVKQAITLTPVTKMEQSDTFVWAVPPSLRNCTFELIAICRQECVSAKLELQPNLGTLEFVSTGTSERDYLKQIQGTVVSNTTNNTNMNTNMNISMVNSNSNNVRQSSNLLQKRLEDYLSLVNTIKQKQEHIEIRNKWDNNNSNSNNNRNRSTSKVMKMMDTSME